MWTHWAYTTFFSTTGHRRKRRANMVKLYHFAPSGPSRGALLAARQVPVPVEVVEVNLFKKEQFNPEFIKVNPQHTVPTLEDGDFVLWDGHAIAAYLVNQYGQDDTLYPKDAKRRAVVDHRLYFDVGVLYPRIREICFPVLFRGETEVNEDKIKSLEEALGWLEGFLSKDTWVAGPNLTIADTSLLASVFSIKEAGYNLSKFPKITAWLGQCELTVKGWEENQSGARVFGEAVRNKLKPGQFQ